MFFQTMFQLMSPGVDYNLTLSRTDGKLTVLVMPKVNGLKDAAQHNLVPFTLCAAPDEIDRGFFPTLQQPLPQAAALLTNMAEYEKQADKAAASSKATKDEKSKADKEAKEKKDKYDGFMKKAGESEAAGDADGALLQLQQARLHATDKAVKTVDEKIAAIKAKTSQGSLFGDTEPQSVAPTASQPVAIPAQPTSQQGAMQLEVQPVPQAQSNVQSMQELPVQSQGAAPQPALPQEVQPMAQPTPQLQTAPPSVYQPMQGQPTPQPQQAQPAIPPQGYPVYPQPPQGGQPGFGAGMFGMAPGNGQGYPQQGAYAKPHGDHSGMAPNPSFMSAGEVYNPSDYADIPDVHLTHVGRVLSNPQSL
jgi:PRTRC genetic system protein E